ncbi:TPA: FadR/GntR family transcriptional regulator [Klebsiella pneumoniae]
MQPSNGARTTSFMRLRQEGRTEEVLRRLIEVIDLGLFAQGEQLPSETELALQFGVATVTLREALAVLRQRGLIETRRGRNGGSFVCATPETSESDLQERLVVLSALELRDLGDEHMAIAGTAARLAAQRSSNEHHQRLAYYIDVLRTASSRLERRRADARFHIEIAVAAQSVRLTHAEMQLQAEVGELAWIEAKGFPDAQAACAEHQAILDAIVNGDTNLAGILAESHVTRATKRLINLRLQLLARKQGEAELA